MESFYFIIVLALIVLAILDLIVGVSNDAVNFLNSAFGSKVAKRKTILTVAAIGILVGALSSSGMMEIARKGIFNPSMFTFADVMTIFLAVMITDILLLDLFNSVGLPTSTTVSIMFELLGAAFLVACIKIIRTEGSFNQLGEYLNGSNALLIISGIFLSVFIAFTVGFFVQFISRLVFSFNLSKTYKRFGSLFGGLAITTITYFLLIKGLKGTNLIPANASSWITNNGWLIIGLLILFWTIIAYLIVALFRINILKVVVLFGTFSLAMAFAGNDLVNFIGVPLAGIQAFSVFQHASLSADELGMAVLSDPIQTNSYILLLAGIIMILALRFSKKAQSVTETELNLASQSNENERFKPNFLARFAVRGGMRLNVFTNRFLSQKMKNQINRKFTATKLKAVLEEDKPAFDLVRAAVNLMTASVLIAFATTMKLPQSTTYVSFMVAMGTSLADRAWSRDAAVYRVAGVIHVIAGWLFTALIAFGGAAILALAIYFGGMVAISGLLILTAIIMGRSHLTQTKKDQKYLHPSLQSAHKNDLSGEEVVDESRYRISITLFKFSCVLRDYVKGLKDEDKRVVMIGRKDVAAYVQEYAALKNSFYYYLQKVAEDDKDGARFYLHALNYLDRLSLIANAIGKDTFDHLNNLHQPMERLKVIALYELSEKAADFFMEISDRVLAGNLMEIKELKTQNLVLLWRIDQLESNHLAAIYANEGSPKNSVLYVSILLNYREILTVLDHLLGLFGKVDEVPTPSLTDRTKIFN